MTFETTPYSFLKNGRGVLNRELNRWYHTKYLVRSDKNEAFSSNVMSISFSRLFKYTTSVLNKNLIWGWLLVFNKR